VSGRLPGDRTWDVDTASWRAEQGQADGWQAHRAGRGGGYLPLPLRRSRPPAPGTALGEADADHHAPVSSGDQPADTTLRPELPFHTFVQRLRWRGRPSLRGVRGQHT